MKLRNIFLGIIFTWFVYQIAMGFKYDSIVEVSRLTGDVISIKHANGDIVPLNSKEAKKILSGSYDLEWDR